MEQFEQLLTCCVCLDRYRNPKLLPCQHSFCMEPCMDGLVDYVRRQVKCPECRAEHRIPYQGVQGFPTNVTLQRFLELHIEISGELPDPTAGQIMERCNVCTEKAYCSHCGHCEKKVCGDCKGAHMDILRREISRINNQVRRGLHRLQDILAVVEKNSLSLQTNCSSVGEEVDEIHRRLLKALKDRTEFLRSEVDRYSGTELKNLTTLKDNLELEISNISSNCDLADKHINEDVEWDDMELMDAKEIFLKTVEFIRNFEYEASDYGRRVRFVMTHDPNQLVLHVAGYGELNINTANTGFTTGGSSSSSLLQPSSGPGLMRSKSDHRLATQFRQQEESRGYGDKSYGDADEPLLGGRKFGDRRPPKEPATDRYSDRYGRSTTDYGGDEYGYEDSTKPRRFRSRFVRSTQGDDSDTEQSSRGVKFEQPEKKEKERVFDTEDVARGPLSGIFRLSDSPRVMKRLQECDGGKKKIVKDVPPPVPTPTLAPPPAKPALKKTSTTAPPPATRQVSEDDEISRIKRQNKGASSSVAEERPAAERVAALKQRSEEEERRRPTREASSEADSDESAGSPQQTQRKTSTGQTVGAAARRSSGTESPSQKKPTRSDSSESSTSSESAPAPAVTPKNTEADKKETSGAGGAGSAQRFQSRFVGGANRPTPAPAEPVKAEESDTSSEEETDSSEESEEDTTTKPSDNQTMAKTDIGPLLARSSNARDAAQENKATKDGSPSYARSQYAAKPEEPSSPVKYRTRPTSQQEEEPPTSRYGASGTTGSGYTSRFLNRNKSSAASPDEDEPKYSSPTPKVEDDPDKYQTGRSRYLALKERRNRLARSRSSHTGFGANDDEDLDEPVSPTTASPSAYLASRYGGSNTGTELARSRSSHALKSRENSPERPSAAGTEKDGAALSSWARYLKSKYGNRAAKDRERDGGASGGLSPSSSSAARRLSLGLPLRSANELTSSDDDQKNAPGSPISPTAATAVVAGFAAAGSSPRSQYLQKRRQLFKVGSRGSEPGSFTWPRGIAVGPDNTMVVADSSNHRVQVFDSNGVFVKEFGSYGSGEGEFDCLAGVAVNRIGQYIIADRYNHRIQVLDPSGRFLRSFGSQGTGDGRFNYPWGITTDALGFIYVCDKENHRVQVFQSDGTFVGKFGSYGHKAGQLEHPHYIAVSNTNRVIVSDSNNHRVQIFDVNGRVLSSFGTEGSEEGQFKFPRGVAVDDQGYICVADSGNNRIQIFHPDGTFLRAFGSWGSGDAEFKGLEGIAVMSNGNIIVCDRENHRVQVF